LVLGLFLFRLPEYLSLTVSSVEVVVCLSICLFV
jgi:hypothetical protein